MASLTLLLLPVCLMLWQQLPRLIDEVKKLPRQMPLQHIQHPVDALQQPVGKAPFFLQRLLQLHVLIMHFVPISPRCDYCTGGARDYYFSAYIRYGMIADESVNIQAGYAHKTIGFGDISVGIDVNGTPSFSASVATVVPYVARAVTVTY